MNDPKEYEVNIGYDGPGRPRNRYFQTMEEAKAFVSARFERDGVVLSIVEVPARKG